MRIIVFLMLFVLPLVSYGQRQNNRSRSEFGVLVGGSYYLGDLNRFVHFRRTNLAGGLIYRYNVHSRVAIRATFTYAQVEGDDADSKFAHQQARNLNFRSTIWELGAGVEFNYWPFQIGHQRYKGTAFLFVGLAGFRMDPTTDYNGDRISLQSLGTEGQGTSLSSRSTYSKYQMAIPFGFGARVSLGKFASLGMEFGIRKTFTDYLDDVRADYYVDYDQLVLENGPIAAELSNRSGSRFGRRGDSSTKDWYVFTGATLTFRLGRPNRCPSSFK